MRILVLSGDGIGPDITHATLKVMQQAAVRFDLPLTFEHDSIGLESLKNEGTTFAPRILEKARACDGVLLGPVSHMDYPAAQQGGLNPSAELRVKLDLYANIRPAKSRMGVGLTGKPVDLVIFREATEGFYADRNMHMGPGEFMPTPDVAIAMRRVTAHCCRRIAEQAFQAAVARRSKVTAVHKANVLRVSDGLFLREVRAVAKAYPQVVLEEVLVDAMAALLVRDPSVFDVIVTGNMFGDILSDEASELAGGLGLAGSINASDVHCVAQAQHGSAPTLAGLDKANPTSLILSAGMMLDWLGRHHAQPHFCHAAAAIENAIDTTLRDPATRTADLKGPLSTTAFTQAVVAKLA